MDAHGFRQPVGGLIWSDVGNIDVEVGQLIDVSKLPEFSVFAKYLAQGGGLRVNDKAETDANRTVTAADLVDGVVKLAAGKKKIVLVKPV